MKISRFLTIVLTLIASACMGSSTLAQDAQVKLKLTPATIDLPSRGEGQTQLVLRNKTQADLQNVKLDWFSGTEAEKKVGRAEGVCDSAGSRRNLLDFALTTGRSWSGARQCLSPRNL